MGGKPRETKALQSLLQENVVQRSDIPFQNVRKIKLRHSLKSSNHVRYGKLAERREESS